MPTQYEYKAVDPDGSRRSGQISANNAQTVEQFLREQKLLPIQIRPIENRRPLSIFGFLRGADYEKLIMFTGALATLYRAGIPLLRALSIIKIGDKNDRFNYAIEHLKTDLHAGKSLSTAMNRFPEIFSPVYVNCIAAGEESGNMDSTLNQLGAVLEQEAELTRQLKSGLRYPAMVICAIVAAFFVIMNFVVPRFMSFYSSFDAELPLPTRIIIATSDFVVGYWPALLATAVAAAFVVRAILRRKAGRLWFDRQLLRMPVIGQLIIKGNVARFSLMFKIMIASGLNIVRSIDILASTIKNTVVAQEIQALGESFRRGREIEVDSKSFQFFPEQALHMLAIGLESGSLEPILNEIGDHYTKQVIHTSRQLTAIIEPVLTLVMGLFVLILALAVFLPMWNLIKVFQG